MGLRASCAAAPHASGRGSAPLLAMAPAAMAAPTLAPRRYLPEGVMRIALEFGRYEVTGLGLGVWG
jgi:hypothetical protein